MSCGATRKSALASNASDREGAHREIKWTLSTPATTFSEPPKNLQSSSVVASAGTFPTQMLCGERAGEAGRPERRTVRSCCERNDGFAPAEPDGDFELLGVGGVGGDWGWKGAASARSRVGGDVGVCESGGAES